MNTIHNQNPTDSTIPSQLDTVETILTESEYDIIRTGEGGQPETHWDAEQPIGDEWDTLIALANQQADAAELSLLGDGLDTLSLLHDGDDGESGIAALQDDGTEDIGGEWGDYGIASLFDDREDI